jgi:hypothetical protein
MCKFLHFSELSPTPVTPLDGPSLINVYVVHYATQDIVRGSNAGGGEIFRTCPDRPWGPPSPCIMGTGSFPGVKSDRGVTLTPHLLLLPWSCKGRAIPVLPLWAVRPVQSLSVCIRVHFTLPYLYTGYTECQTVHKLG